MISPGSRMGRQSAHANPSTDVLWCPVSLIRAWQNPTISGETGRNWSSAMHGSPLLCFFQTPPTRGNLRNLSSLPPGGVDALSGPCRMSWREGTPPRPSNPGGGKGLHGSLRPSGPTIAGRAGEPALETERTGNVATV